MVKKVYNDLYRPNEVYIQLHHSNNLEMGYLFGTKEWIKPLLNRLFRAPAKTLTYNTEKTQIQLPIYQFSSILKLVALNRT